MKLTVSGCRPRVIGCTRHPTSRRASVAGCWPTSTPPKRRPSPPPSTLVAVIAGAGSGKTRVLTRRIAHRIATGTADARHTLALTFTREAAGELRRRLRRPGAPRPRRGRHVPRRRPRPAAPAVDRPRPAPADGRRRPRPAASPRSPRHAPSPSLAAEVEWAAARGITADDYVAAARAAGRRRRDAARARSPSVLADYDVLKRRRGVVDLDDLLALAARELADDPAWAEAVRWRFRHLLVDEAQDLNPLQHRLLELLRRRARRPLPRRRSGPGDLRVQRRRPVAAHRRRRPPARRRGHPPADQPPLAPRPSSPPASTCSRGSGLGRRRRVARAAMATPCRVVAADDEDHEAALVAALVAALDPALVRSGRRRRAGPDQRPARPGSSERSPPRRG